MHAYCLFCETQKCGIIARCLEELYGVRCISPAILQRKWVRGVCTEQRHSWLPGYVFLYAKQPVAEYYRLPGVIRWLGEGELQGQDAAFADALLRCDGQLGAVRLLQTGDRCTLDDPLWAGLHGTVVKLDRGRRRCCVEFVFDQTTRRVWLGYELVRPAADSL